MEKQFLKIEKLVNKIIKNFGDSTLDWTIQVDKNSANPGKITYDCMIHTPTDGVEPLTFVCESWEELEDRLKKASKELDREMVDIAYYKGEVERCERLKSYYEMKLKELLEES